MQIPKKYHNTNLYKNQVSQPFNKVVDMKCNKILRILIILFICITSITTLESSTVYNRANSVQVNIIGNTEPLTPYVLINNINKYLSDHVNGGYISNLSVNGTVLDSSKNINDYISAVNFIIAFTENQKNDTYLNLIPKYLNWIEKFNSQGGYYSSLSPNWSVKTNSYFSSSTLGSLLSMYANLYNLTLISSYLTKAESIQNYLTKNFYDSNHGGFYAQIDPQTLKFNPNTNRLTSTYGIIADAFYNLYLNTNNYSFLDNGLKLLNNTISIAYDSNNNYFYPDLLESTNTLDNSITTLNIADQFNLASSLIKYSNLATPGENSTFNSIATNITTHFITKINISFSFKDQLDFLNYLANLNNSYTNYNNVDKNNYLDLRTTIFDGIYHDNLTLFSNLGMFSPFINFEALKTYENLNYNNYSLNLFYFSETTVPDSFVTIIFPYLLFGVPIVLFLAIFYLRRKETKRLGKLIGQSAPIHRNYIKQSKIENYSGPSELTNKICSNCHQQNLKDDVFCQNCGQRI